MAKLDVINVQAKKVGQVELADAIFSSEVNGALIHEAVRASLANKRVGSACTKTRAEVKGSGVKPYKQKGTGNARHGSWTSPLFVGGGITFGPKPRDYTINLTKKKRRTALLSALSCKLKDNKILVIDEWVEKKKTKEMAVVLNALGVKSALIVLDKPLVWLERAVKNIPYIHTTSYMRLDTLKVISHDFIICSKDAVAKLEEGLSS